MLPPPTDQLPTVHGVSTCVSEQFRTCAAAVCRCACRRLVCHAARSVGPFYAPTYPPFLLQTNRRWMWPPPPPLAASVPTLTR